MAGVTVGPPLIVTPPELLPPELLPPLLLLLLLPQPAASTATHTRVVPMPASFKCNVFLLMRVSPCCLPILGDEHA
jgi:hypothetical protein